MRTTRVARQALRASVQPAKQAYVCRACLAQASRQFSTSIPRPAESNQRFWKRLQNSLFGTKESKQADQSRDEKTKRKIEDAAKRPGGGIETKTDKHGRVYEVADVVDPSINDRYIQSTTWDGLESVGSERWVKERADQGEQYFGFMSPKQRVLSSVEWQNLLHHVTVEALVLQRAGRDLTQICNARHVGDQHWVATGNSTIASNNSQIVVNFANEDEEDSVLSAITQINAADVEWEELVVSEEALQAELRGAMSPNLDLQYPGDSTAWMHVPLQDPDLKLAIIRRVTQLTGKRVPDLTISNAGTIRDLYNSLCVREQATKLAQTDEALHAAQLPNVQIHKSRRTPVHKEKEIGRWKVIEDELTLRDLPIFGSRYVDAKEGKLLQRSPRRVTASMQQSS